MDDLIAFLRARLDECESAARAAFSGQADPENGWGESRTHGYAGVTITPHVGHIHEDVQAAHVVKWNPARVLADVAAKRQITEAYERTAVEEREKNRAFMTALKRGDGGIETLRQIPLLQADHRDADGRKRGLALPVRLLALPYVDHPDYREEWRP